MNLFALASQVAPRVLAIRKTTWIATGAARRA